MINHLKIENFKSIERFDNPIKPLTVLVGKNSTGKSSVIQSILLLCRRAIKANHFSMEELVLPYSNFSDVRNRYKNANTITAEMYYQGKNTNTLSFQDVRGELNSSETEDKDILLYERVGQLGSELFYLSANRIGQENIAKYSESKKVGLMGEFLFSLFERHKSDSIEKALCIDPSSETLSYQLNVWLEIITNIKTELVTQKIGSSNVKVTFNTDTLLDIEPQNLGAGFSYLSKILIICLMAKKGDVVIIENPEIHLHPRSQSLLGVFFSFVAKAGVQLIIETHCEHFLNKLRFQVFDDKIASDDVVIYYKSSVREPFIQLTIDDDGDYLNSNGQKVSFPTGFFDTSNQDLLAIR